MCCLPAVAVPLVAGTAAIYLANNPNSTPQQVAQILTASSTTNHINPAPFVTGTPNRLLYSQLSNATATVQAASGP